MPWRWALWSRAAGLAIQVVVCVCPWAGVCLRVLGVCRRAHTLPLTTPAPWTHPLPTAGEPRSASLQGPSLPVPSSPRASSSAPAPAAAPGQPLAGPGLKAPSRLSSACVLGAPAKPPRRACPLNAPGQRAVAQPWVWVQRPQFPWLFSGARSQGIDARTSQLPGHSSLGTVQAPGYGAPAGQGGEVWPETRSPASGPWAGWNSDSGTGVTSQRRGHWGLGQRAATRKPASSPTPALVLVLPLTWGSGWGHAWAGSAKAGAPSACPWQGGAGARPARSSTHPCLCSSSFTTGARTRGHMVAGRRETVLRAREGGQRQACLAGRGG